MKCTKALYPNRRPEAAVSRRSILDTAAAKSPTHQSFIPCTAEDKKCILMVCGVLRRAPSRSSTCTWTATYRPRTWQPWEESKARVVFDGVSAAAARPLNDLAFCSRLISGPRSELRSEMRACRFRICGVQSGYPERLVQDIVVHVSSLLSCFRSSWGS